MRSPLLSSDERAIFFPSVICISTLNQRYEYDFLNLHQSPDSYILLPAPSSTWMFNVHRKQHVQ